MTKKTLFLSLFLLKIFFCYPAFSLAEEEKGILSIYFREEKVGYEEYIWQSDEMGYTLKVRGMMTRPIPIEIKSLNIRLDKSFIPMRYDFEGSVSGIDQKLSSVIIEGQVENTIFAAGQEQVNVLKVRRDAFLLPNPVFSCYMLLTKKYRCDVQEKLELSAYIIPQIEVPFTLEPEKNVPCSLLLLLSGTEIKLETDEQGVLKSVLIPFQKLRVANDSH
jgi:hypothetical protein